MENFIVNLRIAVKIAKIEHILVTDVDKLYRNYNNQNNRLYD